MSTRLKVLCLLLFILALLIVFRMFFYISVPGFKIAP
jgi:preprotein translocase subunit SecY